MAPELIYMLKVNIGIALFYAFYKLFCCRDTFFQWRRITLLSFLALSFLYPLLNIQAWVKEQPVINELADYYALLMMTDTATANTNAATETAATLPVPDLMSLLIIVYVCGVLILSVRFIIQLLSIFRLVLKSKEVTIDNVRVRSLSDPANPFSFWQWVFIYLPGLKEDERKEIMTHELTHVRQWHSIDVILSEIVNIVCWMNPFMWLLKAEIRLNLEYLADHTVMESVTDTRQYQYHLLGLANQSKQTGLYNNFNLSHLKNRIMMMNKKRTRTTGRIKYALFAPLAAALLLVSNIEAVARTAEHFADKVTDATTVSATATDPAIAQEVTPPQDDPVFQVVEYMPEYPGGMGACIEFIKNNVKYPAKAEVLKREGKVIVQCTIEKDGTLSDIKVARSVSPELDQEAIRVVSTMPKWKPGMQRGKAVRVRYSLPVTFKLEGNNKKASTNEEDPRITGPDANGVYTVVEDMPQYPGGMQACLDFIGKNTQYPATAHKDGIQGRVIVQFIVEKDGTLSNVRIVRSVRQDVDDEAIRVVKTMPTWTPGKLKGKAVRCKYTLPVAFHLQ